MNVKKLIRRAEDFLSSDERKRKEKRKYLKQVIKKLRQHEQNLKAAYEQCADKKGRDQLKKEWILTHAQRKKGVNRLRSLKKKK